jgi:hypothetical protein
MNRAASPGRELQITVLRYAIPIVLRELGWTGDVEIDESKNLRGPGFAASGCIECPSQVETVIAVVLYSPTAKGGTHTVEIQLRGRPDAPLRGAVRVAVAVVAG